MDGTWTVIIIDGVSQPGLWREQDVTRWVDLLNSDFRPQVSDKVGQSRMRLSFPINTPDLSIHEKMEVWAGWRGPGGDWTTAYYGGYIETLTSTTRGYEHTLDLDLADYGCLLSDCEVLRWPRTLDDPILDGYPPDFSAADWLAGVFNVPFTGLIPTFLGGRTGADQVAWDIDPVFADILFTNTLPGDINSSLLPGDEAVYGQWMWVSLRKIIEDICDAVIIVDPTVRPVFWMRAVADGPQIRPLFRLANTAEAPATPDLIFAATPGDGEFPIWHPFTHKRDSKLVRTRVTVKGQGADTSTLLNQEDAALYADASVAGGVLPLNYYTVAVAEHIASAPTRYFSSADGSDPGWSGAPIEDPRINTLAKAQRIAEQIETQVWGARGEIIFWTDQYIEPGQWIQIKDPVEFGDTDPIYPVNDVEMHLDPTLRFKITCGHTPLDVGDILKGGTADIPILSHDTGRAAAAAWGKAHFLGGAGGVGGLPRDSAYPLVRRPIHSQQNVVKPWHNGYAAVTIQQSRNYEAPADGSPPVPRASPESLVTVRDQYGNVTAWNDHHGYAHPITFNMSFGSDGRRRITAYTDIALVQELIQPIILNGGAAVAYTLVSPANVQTTPSAPSVVVPLVMPQGYTLLVDVTGVDGTVGLALQLTEVKPRVTP